MINSKIFCKSGPLDYPLSCFNSLAINPQSRRWYNCQRMSVQQPNVTNGRKINGHNGHEFKKQITLLDQQTLITPLVSSASKYKLSRKHQRVIWQIIFNPACTGWAKKRHSKLVAIILSNFNQFSIFSRKIP